MVVIVKKNYNIIERLTWSSDSYTTPENLKPFPEWKTSVQNLILYNECVPNINDMYIKVGNNSSKSTNIHYCTGSRTHEINFCACFDAVN